MRFETSLWLRLAVHTPPPPLREFTTAPLKTFVLTFSDVQPPRPWQRRRVYCHIAENKEQGSKTAVISSADSWTLREWRNRPARVLVFAF